MAGKQLLYQESSLSFLIRNIFQNGQQQAFKNLEAMLSPDIARKYVIIFILLPPPEHQPPAFLFLFYSFYSFLFSITFNPPWTLRVDVKLCPTTRVTLSINCPAQVPEESQHHRSGSRRPLQE